MAITPQDDYTHAVGPESNFNESMYFQFYAAERRLGGFLRLANRPNEGIGERTVCLYLPDGVLGFTFARPSVTGNEKLCAAGLTVDVVTGLDEVDVSYAGTLTLVDDPRAMVEPKVALAAGRTVDCRIRLNYRAAAPAYAETFDGDGESFAPNHYEQLAAVTGTVEIAGHRTPIHGHGLRDHSWGPRSWQAPWFYRWIHGSGEGFGFMFAYFGDPQQQPRTGGFVWDGDELHVCTDITVQTVRDADHYQQTVALHAAAGGRRWSLTGEALSSVPLRHRNGTASTRIVESAMRWTGENGATYYGMAEYLDQIQHGRPVGLAI